MVEQALFEPSTLVAYCLAAAVLVLTPGPGQALVVARAVEGGTRAGLLTAFGLEIGTMLHTLAAALGLSAILATSATAYSVVKYAGAAYLIVLGMLALRHARQHAAPPVAPSRGNGATPGSRLVLHGALTGTLNPKVALFFLAFLPQFVEPQRGAVFLQFVVLGLILGSIAMAWDSVIAAAAGGARSRLLASPRWVAWRNRVSGLVLLGLGLRLAFSERAEVSR